MRFFIFWRHKTLIPRLIFVCKLFQMKIRLLLLMMLSAMLTANAQNDINNKPLRVVVAGLSHDHVGWILGYQRKEEVQIVGIAEPNKDLAERHAKRYGFSMDMVYPTLDEAVKATKPEAVLGFGSIFQHLSIVEYCAPKGIHVMVEKPMAVNNEHAAKMLALAKKYNIQLLTNYETTWYGSNEKAYQLLSDNQTVGDIRKIVFHTGHQGPVEIGCSKEFLSWLTDPVQNGAGALNDFGCYGADIATWLLKGETPVSVTAVTQHIKPAVYPKVEDEATIIVAYKKAQVIIQASWNWPYGRKDMEVYGVKGYVFCKDGTNMLVREDERKDPIPLQADALPADRNDPFIYFKNVIRGTIKMNEFDLSAPATNEMVVKILAAAKQSAATGQTVFFSK